MVFYINRYAVQVCALTYFRCVFTWPSFPLGLIIIIESNQNVSVLSNIVLIGKITKRKTSFNIKITYKIILFTSIFAIRSLHILSICRNRRKKENKQKTVGGQAWVQSMSSVRHFCVDNGSFMWWLENIWSQYSHHTYSHMIKHSHHDQNKSG